MLPFRFFILIFFDMLCVASAIPLLPIISARLNMSQTLFGAAQSVYGLSQCVSTPLMGILSDRIGRVDVLLISTLGTAVAYIFLATAAASASVTTLFVSRAIVGLLRQTMSTSSALISDFAAARNDSVEKRRTIVAANLARLGAVSSLAFVLGPAIGSTLSIHIGVAQTAFVAATVGVATSLAGWYSLRSMKIPRIPPVIESAPNVFFRCYQILLGKEKHSFARGLMIALFLLSAANITAQNTLAQRMLRFYEFPLDRAGFVISGSSGLQALVQGIFTPLLVRHCSAFLLCVGSLVFTLLGYLLQALEPQIAVFLIGVSLVSLTAGIADSILRSAFGSLFPAAQAGEVMAIVFTMDGFNRVVCPLAAGLASDYLSSRLTGFFVAISVATSLSVVCLRWGGKN